MRFEPKTEDEVQAEQLCPEGKQAFTVLQASEGLSKKGQPQVKLKLNVHGEDGFDYHVYDYISPHYMAFKFRHFFYSIGQGGIYEAGSFEVNRLVGAQGWAEVKVKGAKDGYPAKNEIVDYPKDNAAAATAKQVAPDGAVAAQEDDSDVPF